MEVNFVEFYSPGTFVAESTIKPIESWDVEKAVEMSGSIIERYGARPYAFRFIKRAREDSDLDSKIVDKSCLYYLGGVVETIEQISKRGDKKDKILLSNMQCNGWRKVIRTSSGWTLPLEYGDTVLPAQQG